MIMCAFILLICLEIAVDFTYDKTRNSVAWHRKNLWSGDQLHEAWEDFSKLLFTVNVRRAIPKVTCAILENV